MYGGGHILCRYGLDLDHRPKWSADPDLPEVGNLVMLYGGNDRTDDLKGGHSIDIVQYFMQHGVHL